jgi:hypothetical protein
MTETELVAKEEVEPAPLGIIKVRLEQNMPLVLLTQMKLEFKVELHNKLEVVKIFKFYY